MYHRVQWKSVKGTVNVLFKLDNINQFLVNISEEYLILDLAVKRLSDLDNFKTCFNIVCISSKNITSSMAFIFT